MKKLFATFFLSISITIDMAVATICDSYGRGNIYNETIDLQSQQRILQSNSCPNHYSVCQDHTCASYNITYAHESINYIELPLYPYFANKITYLTCSLDTIVAIALNGVPIYSMVLKKH